ncbi:MAG: pyridoxal-phosphate dependent enzyme [Bacteroidia bacterium]
MENPKSSLHLATPLLESHALNARLGKRVYFKMESHQPTRSFKLRGMGHLVTTKIAEGQRDFIASSGGNAGYSLAYAAARLGGRVHVVVPQSTPERMRTLIAGEGATVQVHGESWNDANELALELVGRTGGYYVSPFDDALLWEGHSTLIDECVTQMPEPDIVVAAVGGGGLLAGILQGMERYGWKRASMIAAETEGAASYHAALEAGKLVTLDKIDTVATTLGARRVAAQAFDWSKRRNIQSHVCTDAEAVGAVRSFANDLGVLVEASCGAALSTVYLPSPKISDADTILVVVCGGAAMDFDGLNALIDRLL